MSAAEFFNAVRRYKRELTGKPGVGLTDEDVKILNEATVGRWSGDKPPEVTPDPDNKLNSKTGPLVAIVGAVAATSLFATVPKHEGTEYKAYRDIASVWTVCQGDTNDVHPGLIETPEGCRIRLERQLVAHASGVMACTPRLKEDGRDWQRAAATSLAYNIGVGAWCKSTADKRFDVADWRGGCDAFLSWNKARVGGQLRPVLGLTRRRTEERQICLRGLT